MYNTTRAYIILCFVLFVPSTSSADEGMWLPMFLKKLNISAMQAKGLSLTADEIYNINSASLKDAIVSFNGYCTGEMIKMSGKILLLYQVYFPCIMHSCSEYEKH